MQAEKSLIRKADKLEESRKHYYSLFNKNRDGYVINLGSGELLDPNPAFAKMLGYTVEEVKKLSFWDITPKKWIEWETKVHGKKLLKRGYTDLYEKEYIRKDGTVFPIEVQAFLLNEPADLGSALIGAFVRDITERISAEQNKMELESQLRQLQKNEAIGALAGGIAHDFNNILFPIIGFTELIDDDLSEDSPFKESIDEILTASRRAKELVEQILTFSRQAEQEVKPLKPDLIIKEVMKLIVSTLPKTIEINH